MAGITIKNICSFFSGEGKPLTAQEEQSLNSIFNRSDTENAEDKYLGEGKGDGSLNNNEWSLFIQKLMSHKWLYDRLTNFINNTNDNIQYDYFAKNKVMNPCMYNEEVLRKRFPEDKYELKTSEEAGIKTNEVIDKSTNEIILKYEYLDTNYISITSNNLKLTYYKATLYEEEDLTDGTKTEYEYDNGHVKKNITKGNSVDIRYEDDKLVYKYTDNQEYELSDDGSYRTFDAKTGIETYYDAQGNVKEQKDAFVENLHWIIRHQDTKEDLINLLNSSINKDNALQILSDTRTYNVINNVLSELCIDSEEDEKQVKLNLFNTCVEQAENLGFYTKDLKNNPCRYNVAKLMARCDSEQGDLKIEPITKDTKFEQGLTGNCWLLEKIAAMAQTEDGLEILNNMYKPIKNHDGSIKSVKVTVQGKEYNIPLEEIKGSNELSSGNLYVRAIEIGVLKYLEELGQESAFGLEDPAFMKRGERWGGTSSLGSEILVGNGIELEQYGSCVRYVDKTRPIDDDFMRELMNTQNAIIGVSTAKGGFKAYVMETGEQEDIVSHHAYSVVSKDNKYLYLVEPSNNKKTLRITYEEFKNCFEVGDITPINKPQKNDEKVFMQTGSIFVSFHKNKSGTRKETITEQEQRIKAQLEERFDSSKYDVDVIYNGKYFEYSITPKRY